MVHVAQTLSMQCGSNISLITLHTSAAQVWHDHRGSTARARRTRPRCCVLLLRSLVRPQGRTLVPSGRPGALNSSRALVIRRCALHAKPPTSPSAAALSHQRSPVRVLSLRSLVPFMGRILMCSGCHWALISLHLLVTRVRSNS